MKPNGPPPITLPVALDCWDIDDIYSYVPEPREDLVDELIPLGSSTLFAAREKTGKTRWLVDLCCSVALGQDFLGRITRAADVLLVAVEDHVREIQSLILTRLGGQRPPTMHWLPPRYVGLNDRDLRLEDEGLMLGFGDLIRRKNVQLVALDPLRELHDMAENDSDEMAPTLRVLRDIAHEQNIAVITAHHAGIDGKYRGSTAIGGAVDQILQFKREDQQGNEAWVESVPRGLLRVEGRYGPRQVIAMTYTDRLRWEVEERAVTPKAKQSTRTRLVDLLKGRNGVDNRAAGEPLTAEEIGLLIACNVGTVKNTITEMKKEQDCNLLTVQSQSPSEPDRYRWKTVEEAMYGLPLLEA